MSEAPPGGSSPAVQDDFTVAEFMGDVPEENGSCGTSSPKWSDVKMENMLPSKTARVQMSATCPSSDASICTLGGGKPLKTQGSWSEAMRATTIGPRAAGAMLKVPLRRLLGHSKRKSWNSNMESYIGALHSVGKHLSGMSVERFRFAQSLHIDGQEEALKLTWIWPNEITPLRPPELAVQKVGPSISVLKENPVILYVPGTPFCVWGKGVHRYMCYLLAKRAEAVVYKHLIETIGVDPGAIAVAGDSLGAGMVMLALMALRNEGIALPSSVCLISPITDLADQVDDFSDEFSSSTDERKSSNADKGTEKKKNEEEMTGGLGDDIGTSSDAVGESESSKPAREKSVDEEGKNAEVDAGTEVNTPPKSAVSSRAAAERKECVDYVQRDLVMIQAGQEEIFLPQIERFSAKASAMKNPDTHFQFQVYEEMIILDDVIGVVAVNGEVKATTIAPCSVCLDNPGDMVVLPCGHAGICQSCAVHIASNEAVGGSCCPKCRTEIDQLVRIGKVYDTSIQGIEAPFTRQARAPPVPSPPGLEKMKGQSKS
ncbi:hypothetical protein Pmar_PMAR006555 [Perkinsus marinus ATCC 50983]|uniref:RING-type domain-containing protein n=1 Tax=Perkinsus marinus (strain ATCC 50983 / TXsc) TaxID=423536 RepID=C5LTS1_PERM5|nr:hypothetical protein Pmar_PMAR006555 [Perkinsus marinus ATCC 50983]EEQ99883.1 hypothetical protein Pmar_PMAR006555 [Perkinsus marinus ATCC 50983]|eukprot:XP_002767166.1 hypothetical protein Pmar_PMAR006555 [Perkinsus marinus ATCC 50983]